MLDLCDNPQGQIGVQTLAGRWGRYLQKRIVLGACWGNVVNWF